MLAQTNMGRLVQQEHVHCHEVCDACIGQLRKIQLALELSVQVKECMDRDRADISAFYLHVRSGNACRGSGFAPFVVDDAPQINGGQQEAFSCVAAEDACY